MKEREGKGAHLSPSLSFMVASGAARLLSTLVIRVKARDNELYSQHAFRGRSKAYHVHRASCDLAVMHSRDHTRGGGELRRTEIFEIFGETQIMLDAWMVTA
jgi:hypothetical protein